MAVDRCTNIICCRRFYIKNPNEKGVGRIQVPSAQLKFQTCGAERPDPNLCSHS